MPAPGARMRKCIESPSVVQVMRWRLARGGTLPQIRVDCAVAAAGAAVCAAQGAFIHGVAGVCGQRFVQPVFKGVRTGSHGNTFRNGRTVTRE